MINLKTSNRNISEPLKANCLEALSQLMRREDLGFLDLPNRSDNWKTTDELSKDLIQNYESVVFVGIGGSGLGGKTIRSVFANEFEAERIHFLENVDSSTVDLLFRKLKVEKTAWVFTSKSGTTLETLALANEVNLRLKESELSLKGRVTVITENKPSPLLNWGRSIDAKFLEIPEDVGGRFSVLTPVGLLPAAVMGVPIGELRQGAFWALEQKQLVAELAAHALESFSRQEWITQFWVYSDRLSPFGFWLQQLWAESLAKAKQRGSESSSQQPPDRVSTPLACTGATDQHSLLQQVIEGENDKCLWFFRIEQFERSSRKADNMFLELEHLSNHSLDSIREAEADATQQALSRYDVSNLEVSIRDLSPGAIGALFMTFELLIGTLGEVLNINAFDQPGVELGKKLAKQIL